MTPFAGPLPVAAWALALSLGAFPAAQAQAPAPGTAPPAKGQGGMRVFQMVDTNKDGAVSREEFAAFQAQRFARLDTNKDGSVSREEFLAAPAGRGAQSQGAQPGNQASPQADRRREMRERRFKALDKNGDAKLSLAEYQGGGQGFDQLDRNRDGKLTPDEIQALREERSRR